MSDLSSSATALLRQARANLTPDEESLCAVREALAARLAAPQLAPDEMSHATTNAALKKSWLQGLMGGSVPAVWVVSGGLAALALGAGAVLWQSGLHASPSVKVGVSSTVVAVPGIGAPVVEPLQDEAEARDPARDRGSREGVASRARPVEDSSVSHARRRNASARGSVQRDGHGGADTLVPQAVEAGLLQAPAAAQPAAATEQSGLVAASQAVAASNLSTAPEAGTEVAALPLEPETAARPVGNTLAAEFALIRRARAFFERGDATSAVEVLDHYAELHPGGDLKQEELVLRVLSLCVLGRERAARASAEKLQELSPRSPHFKRLANSCVGVMFRHGAAETSP